MRPLVPFVSVTVLALLFLAGCGGEAVEPPAIPPVPQAVTPDPSVEKVREMLNGIHFKDEQTLPLFALGSRLFPAFEVILADTESKSQHVERALFILTKMKTDRRRFLDFTINRLADPDWGVRWTAVRLLADIGSAENTPAIIPLLADEEIVVYNNAAATLAKIGDKRALDALDALLKAGKHPPNDGQFLVHVKKCREELEKRLKETPIPKDTKN